MIKVTRVMTSVRRLGRDDRGTSILELALCSPVLLTFLVGIVDVAMFAHARLTAEQAVYRGLEVVQVGGSANAFNSTETINQIKAEVAAAAGSGVTASSVTVSPELYCDGGTPLAYTGSCEDGEDLARYVNVTAAGQYDPYLGSMTALFFDTATPDGKIPFTAAAAVRVQ